MYILKASYTRNTYKVLEVINYMNYEVFLLIAYINIAMYICD